MKNTGHCIFLLSTLFYLNSFAQVKRCSTDEYYEQMKVADSELESKVNNARQAAYSHLANRGFNKQGGRAIITIPVVVHVMHTGSAIGTGANISDAQVFSQIDVLNEDYRALNADITNVPAHFSGVIADVEVEFCLALFDPEGNSTNGIDRVNMGSGGTWSDSRKPGTVWDNSQYLNIWVTDILGGTLGYATFPGTSPTSDGVVIDYMYFGRTPQNPFNSKFDLGRTGTHEIGHWLGLDHTFQGGCSGTSSTNCSTNGDRVCDTPPTSSANYGCSLSTTRNTCTETPVDQPDMWMNYLDYMDDACLLMFSQGQADVMLAVLNTSRASIKSSIACQSQNTFTYNGQVVDAVNGQGVQGAKVLFSSNTFQFETIADANGNFTHPNFREGTYSIFAGKWGYMTKEFSQGTFITDSTASIIVPIDSGFYYDDFILDYGWAVSGSAVSGVWERGIPVGTTSGSVLSNPGNDVAGDFGEKCFVTGNGGGQAGNDDVDDGNTILTSPVFDLTGFNEPYIHYQRWFFNGGGTGTPNDKLVISISNGIVTEEIETLDVNTPNANQWNAKSIRVPDYITPTANMRFILETSDLTGSGHLVEGALDKFFVVDSMPNIPTVNNKKIKDPVVLVYPNPAKNILLIDIRSVFEEPVTAEFFNADGRFINRQVISKKQGAKFLTDVSNWNGGVYWVRLSTTNGTISKRFTVIH